MINPLTRVKISRCSSNAVELMSVLFFSRLCNRVSARRYGLFHRLVLRVEDNAFALFLGVAFCSAVTSSAVVAQDAAFGRLITTQSERVRLDRSEW